MTKNIFIFHMSVIKQTIISEMIKLKISFSIT